MAEIRMPKMGDGMEEGTIITWFKQEGDHITSGEPIAEVETDKASVEISAYETGTLTKIVVPVGKTVPVGEVIAMIGEEAGASSNGAHAHATPAESVTVRSVAGERVKSSPLARRIAAELGVDIALVLGSGPGGRIVERDVRAHAEKVGARPMPKMETPAPKVETAPAQAPPSAPIAAPPMAPVLAGADIEPSQMRKAIAKRTAQSKQHAPHFYVTMVIEMDRALALLKELNADAMDSKVTVNDLVVKACAVALGRVPEVNATWTPDGKIRRYAEAHIGVAVGVEDGLIIPVIRDCHAKPLRQISADAKGLIHKARNHQLKPEEYSGGTFSISNMGMMGVDEFIAIINPPEAAILAVGTATREPVVGENDAIVIKTRMKVSLSADHRVLDGVTAARFLQEVKKALEAPFSLLS